MWRTRGRWLVLVATCTALALAACSDDPTSSEEGPSDGHDHSHDVGEATDNFEFTLGKPGDAADATRSIKVDAVENFRFKPATVRVETGETVTFEVTNRDEIEHEFVLGNEEYQALHDSQVKAGGVYHNYSAYSVHVTPGETMSVTWTFERAGRVQYACHVEGHYDQGMIGNIRVS